MVVIIRCRPVVTGVVVVPDFPDVDGVVVVPVCPEMEGVVVVPDCPDGFVVEVDVGLVAGAMPNMVAVTA